MRSPLWTTLLIATALAVIVGQANPDLVLPVAAGALGGGFSWWFGFTQGRRRGRVETELAHARRMLGTFSAFAERALAAAPEDLDEDGEAMREDLQQRYQQAQKLLARIPRL